MLGTTAVLVLAFVLALWASSIPPVYNGPHMNCDYHTDRLAADLSKFALYATLGAGLAAFLGLLGAWGWRWFFVPLVVASPILLLIAAFSTLYVPPGCPGLFS